MPDIDLSAVPYAALASELARRNRAKRSPGQMGGRPIKLAPCPRCGQVLSAVRRRKACPAHGAE